LALDVTICPVVSRNQKMKRGEETGSARATSTRKLADRASIGSPEEVLAAAELAAPVFHIAKYYRAIRLMREKGYSWRGVAEWLKQFGIEISYVHLRRIYVAEDKRLARFSERQLREIGMPPDLIKDAMDRDAPVDDALAAPDPDDEGTVEEKDLP
jgi:hypothetical protein